VPLSCTWPFFIPTPPFFSRNNLSSLSSSPSRGSSALPPHGCRRAPIFSGASSSSYGRTSAPILARPPFLVPPAARSQRPSPFSPTVSSLCSCMCSGAQSPMPPSYPPWRGRAPSLPWPPSPCPRRSPPPFRMAGLGSRCCHECHG
jgi:hypothetical protein